MKKEKAFLLTLLLAVESLSACGGAPAASNTPTGGDNRTDFAFGTYAFTKLDPADDYNGWATVRYGIGETLFTLDDSLNIQKNLVTDYSLSDDSLTWTLTLRGGVLFHNGDAMDGAAVKSSLERLVATNDRAASDLMIDSISADGNTVAITTTEPNPILLNALCDPYACIVDAAADGGSGEFEEYPVCTGPYVVKQYVEDSSAYLEPFDQYWGGTPASKSVTIKAISDTDTLSLAMQNGEIDAAYGLSYDTLSQFKDDAAFQVSQAATTRVYMLYFNQSHKFMSDENFRRAICMAVDKNSYASVLLNGAGTPTKSAFPDYLSYGDDNLMTDVPDYDPKGAKALLKSSGYVDTDGDGFLDKDGQKVSLRLITYGRTGLPQSAQALQSALIQLGMDVSFEQVETVNPYLTADNYDICVYAYVTTPTGDPLSYLSYTMGTGNGSNFGHYSDAQVNDLLSKLATEFDVKKRSDYALQIQQTATKDSSYCYLFHLNMFLVMKAGVTGMKQSPVDYYQITAKTAAA
ncbi:ABC transporter substrate-binding protein [Oscillibacter sp.]|uniref:ABC transporter substrate-binding protein n=1 Tax=Oscillibacter sp. TaxID=1945593 RepID=UPI00289AE3B1|nr:ABC transporter substrate-binding protein [Oscillibacter sp.]